MSAQFSVRGGIFDIYSFGMADPVRLEFWGDEIVELRHFDLHSQRSTRVADVAVILPVDGQLPDETEEEFERVSVTSLWPPETIVLLPGDAHIEPELQRTWDEAQHHLDLARRRGEDVPKRDELFQAPSDVMAHALGVRHRRPDARRGHWCGRRSSRCATLTRSTATSSASGASCVTGCRRSSCATTRARPSVSMSC